LIINFNSAECVLANRFYLFASFITLVLYILNVIVYIMRA